MWLDDRVLKGFKDFVLRGNVVDLAVAVVIGAAFTAVVNAFAADFLTPLIGLVGGGGKFGGQLTVAGQAFKWGPFISQVITFVLTAAVVYFLIVVPMHTIMERRRRGEEPGPVQPTELQLLTEIPDLLRAQQAGTSALPVGAPAPVCGAPVADAHPPIPPAGQPVPPPPPGRPLPPVPPRRKE
jgi:large conductance mechanosensitive channel